VKQSTPIERRYIEFSYDIQGESDVKKGKALDARKEVERDVPYFVLRVYHSYHYHVDHYYYRCWEKKRERECGAW
jgi:hypothetical protein